MTKRLLIALFVATLVAPLPSGLALSADAEVLASQAPPTPPAAPEPPAKPMPPTPPAAPAQPARQVGDAPLVRSGGQTDGQQNANVQLDVVVTDTISGKPEGKRVTLLLRNGHSGSLRTKGQIWVDGQLWAVELGLDGRVRILGPGLIEAMVTFTYAAPPLGSGASGEEARRQLSPPAEVTESLTAMLRSGQPMLVSRSADPVTNRTVAVELTATIREP